MQITTEKSHLADLELTSIPRTDAARPAIPVFNRDIERVHGHYRYRPFHVYEELLGDPFKAKTSTAGNMRLLDIGGGLGLAGMQFAHKRPGSRVTVINSMDLVHAILECPKDQIDTIPNPEKILLASLCQFNRSVDHLMRLVHDEPIFAPNWREDALAELAEIIKALRESGRFDYRVGYAEDLLPVLTQPSDVITDVYGAYYYSGARIDLLEEYYRLLAPSGEAFIIFATIDRHYSESGWKPHAHGPKSAVGDLSLEQFLVQSFPHIFSSYQAGNYQQETKILRMVRNDDLIALPLHACLKVKSMSFEPGADSYQAQLPKVEYVSV